MDTSSVLMMTSKFHTREIITFCILCFCWGSTFITLKEGLGTLPPLLFAGLRFVLAAVIFGIIVASRGMQVMRPTSGEWRRLLTSSLLVITLNYGFVFWGAQFLPAGISGLVSFASVALWLTALGLLSRAEPVRPAVLIGLACGICGFALLIFPKLGDSPRQVLGIAAMFAAGLAHSQGSLWVKPVLERHGALVITMIQMAVGGMVLLGLSVLLESPNITVLQGLREARALLSLLYLVGVGSLLGFWLYNRLLTRWAPSQVALYTFVSPLVSLSLGALIYHERMAGLEVWAMLCLLAAVVVNFWGRLTTKYHPQRQQISSETS